jgi:hypothetical protein
MLVEQIVQNKPGHLQDSQEDQKQVLVMPLVVGKPQTRLAFPASDKLYEKYIRHPFFQAFLAQGRNPQQRHRLKEEGYQLRALEPLTPLVTLHNLWLYPLGLALHRNVPLRRKA